VETGAARIFEDLVRKGGVRVLCHTFVPFKTISGSSLSVLGEMSGLSEGKKVPHSGELNAEHARKCVFCGGAYASWTGGGQRRISQPVRRACAYLQENYLEPIGLSDVVRVAGLSRHHFCRIFRKETGRTVTEYIAVLRVRAAAESLMRGDARVSEVALAVGFQSISQFNRTFRAVLGESPTEWRARQG
jgi:AraC-like DNA-binding protein